MAKLTDSQLVVLSKAAQREDGTAVMPDRMNKAAAMKIGSSLVSRKLMREIRAKPDMPTWREDGDGRRYSLILTRAGRDAIGVEDEEGTPAAIAQNSPSTFPQPEQAPTTSAPRAGSKQALVIAMLSNNKSATIDAMVEATGWLPHTARAALNPALCDLHPQVDRA